MNLYCIRSKPHNQNREEEFLNGHISIGWPCGMNLKNKTRKELSDILKTRYSTISEIAISQINEFINIPDQSIILTPSIKGKNLVHIFKTTNRYEYDDVKDNEKIGNPHFVRADLIETIDKEILPKKILSSLTGSRKTISNISQHNKMMENFLNPSNKNENTLKTKYLKILEELTESNNEEIKLKATIELLQQIKE